MGCCGKIEKGIRILKGNLAVVLEKLNALPRDAFMYHALRLKACQACDYHTYLTTEEYLRWIADNGGIEAFVAQIESLEDWPSLPVIQEQKDGAKLFCSLCKCWVPAKSYVKEETCPVHHPDWRKPKCFFNHP